MSEENNAAEKAEAKNEKKPAAKTAAAKKAAKTPAKWGHPDWACEHPWSDMDRKQRRRVVGLLPDRVAAMIDEHADLRERMEKMYKYLSSGESKKYGELEQAISFAQGMAMDNYECFLRQRVDNAVHDVLRDLWSKKETK